MPRTTLIVLASAAACNTDTRSTCMGPFDRVSHSRDTVLGSPADLPTAELFCTNKGSVVIARVESTTAVQRDGMTYTHSNICVERTLQGTPPTRFQVESIGGKTPGGGTLGVGGMPIPEEGTRVLWSVYERDEGIPTLRDALDLDPRAPLQAKADYEALWSDHCAEVDYDEPVNRL